MWAEANQYNPLNPSTDSKKYIKRTVPIFYLKRLAFFLILKVYGKKFGVY